MSEFLDLIDRTEFTTKEGDFVEEFMCVDCPQCGVLATSTVTGKDCTWYVHGRTACKVRRGSELIPEPIMYAKAENVELHDLVISSAVRLW